MRGGPQLLVYLVLGQGVGCLKLSDERVQVGPNRSQIREGRGDGSKGLNVQGTGWKLTNDDEGFTLVTIGASSGLRKYNGFSHFLFSLLC